MQEILDRIYERSVNKALNGADIYALLVSKENILLAYRNIKSNTGSKTRGTDGMTIDNFKVMNVEELIERVRAKVKDYQPDAVRRVYIPKEYGEGMRPLGIPTMWDRLIQQMFKQVLEPIVEAQFHNHSYGFRPNRSTHHAMARCQTLINISKLHYVVDIDIKSFFDNVNHRKLIQQLYTIGIHDKRILTILAKMLRAPIKGEGTSTKGTPQGGVLSTLLSGVVLNELDWWISSQWETFEIEHQNGCRNRGEALKKTKLKEMYIVRYADDVKVFTRTLNEARLIQRAMIDFLEKRLHLEIAEEKSKITNLKRERSTFLGFDMEAVKKKQRYVARTHINKKRKKRIRKQIKKRVVDIQKNPTKEKVDLYNATVLGIQDYFRYATYVNIDLSEIHYSLLPVLHNRLKINMKYGKPERPSGTYQNRYRNEYKTYRMQGVHLYPLADIQTKNVVCFSQNICNYTKAGRSKKHRYISSQVEEVIQEMHRNKESYQNQLEYFDNRISRYSMQRGRCAITGEFLSADKVYCHHKVPKHLNGDDRYQNLVIVHKDVEDLIHMKNEEEIQRYLEKLSLNKKQLKKLNNLRKKCNLPCINR